MRDNNQKAFHILAIVGILPIAWIGLLLAPSVKGGLAEIVPSLMTLFEHPFQIELCEDSVKTVLILLLIYGMGMASTSPPDGITAGVRNTALLSGAMRES